MQEGKWKKGETEYTSMNWGEIVLAHLGPSYEFIAEVSMWEMCMLIAVRVDYKRFITNIDVRQTCLNFTNNLKDIH